MTSRMVVCVPLRALLGKLTEGLEAWFREYDTAVCTAVLITVKEGFVSSTGQESCGRFC